MAGKIYYFSPKDLEMSRGTHVIVETARGVEYGTVIIGPKEIPEEEVVQPLKAVIRVATPADEDHEKDNRFREREAYLICKEKIRAHNLEMKLIKSEYTFDNNKLLFYFTADGRVDFRNLVKDLASVFHTRIELRQVGVRDETKILGGLGICGRELCCHTFLSDFAPVSIKMAKEQNLSLNPAKISGVCGRLMCCLNNEADTYKHLNRDLPKNGSCVRTPEGLTGTVHNVNVLRQTVKVLIEQGDEREIREYAVEDLRKAQHEIPEEEGRSGGREMIHTDGRTAGRSGHEGQGEAGKNKNHSSGHTHAGRTAGAGRDSGRDRRSGSGDRREPERRGGKGHRTAASGGKNRSYDKSKPAGAAGEKERNREKERSTTASRDRDRGKERRERTGRANDGERERSSGKNGKNGSASSQRPKNRTRRPNSRPVHHSGDGERSRENEKNQQKESSRESE
jgi:cell fate regulator YaaT (PSP1 superfamily)